MKKIFIFVLLLFFFVYSKILVAVTPGVAIVGGLLVIGVDDKLKNEYTAYSAFRNLIVGLIGGGLQAVLFGTKNVLGLVKEYAVDNVYNCYEATVLQAEIDSKGANVNFSDPWKGGGEPDVNITVEEQRFHSQTGEEIVADKSWGGWGAAILRQGMCGAMTDRNRLDERFTYQVVKVDGSNPEESEGDIYYDPLRPATATVGQNAVGVGSTASPNVRRFVSLFSFF